MAPYDSFRRPPLPPSMAAAGNPLRWVESSPRHALLALVLVFVAAGCGASHSSPPPVADAAFDVAAPDAPDPSPDADAACTSTGEMCGRRRLPCCSHDCTYTVNMGSFCR